MILPWPGVAHVEIRFHIGPLAQVEIQVGMGVGVAILAVNIIDAPGRVLYVTSAEVLVVARTEFLVPTLSVGTRNDGWIKRYGVLSFFGYFIMKDKPEFLNKSEK